MKIGQLVRFNHERDGGPVHRVVSVMQDGSIELHDMTGYFAPHIFTNADDIGGIPLDMSNEEAIARVDGITRTEKKKMRELSTAQIIEVGRALLPYLRHDLSLADLGRASHDAAAALLRAKFGDIGLTGGQVLALACGNDPYADEKICPECHGRGHVSIDLDQLSNLSQK